MLLRGAGGGYRKVRMEQGQRRLPRLEGRNPRTLRVWLQFREDS
jgi:hypothetical protein